MATVICENGHRNTPNLPNHVVKRIYHTFNCPDCGADVRPVRFRDIALDLIRKTFLFGV